MNNVLRMLNQAVKIAASTKQKDKNFFLAALALREDGVLVASVNSTIMEHPTPSAHAEARVSRKAGVGSIMWVARVLKDKKTWAMAKPCQSCSLLIVNKMVKKVYYTIGPGEYGVWYPEQGNNHASYYYEPCEHR